MKPLRVVLFSVLLFISSCGVDQYVATSTTHPPAFTFNADSTVIAVINGFDFDQLNLHNKKKLSIAKGGAFTSIAYVEDQLKQLHGVKVINLVADSGYATLDSSSLKNIAAEHHADYVLALTKYYARFNSDNLQTYKNDKGVEVKTVDYKMDVTTNYTLYNKNGGVYNEFKGNTNDYTSTQQVPGVFWADIFGPGIKGNSAQVNNSAIHATQAALQGLFPSITTVNRAIYTDDDLKNAADEMMAHNFKKADSLLQPLLLNQNAELAAKAAYNLAVVYEAQGDINRARDMVQISLDKNDNRKARTMYADIQGNTNAAVSP